MRLNLTYNVWIKAIDSVLYKDSGFFSSVTRSFSQCISPPLGWIKINFYGSFQESTGVGMPVAIAKVLGAITRSVKA